MNRLSFQSDAANERPAAGRDWVLAGKLDEAFVCIVRCRNVVLPLLQLEHYRKFGVTQLCGGLYYAVEDRLQIKGGPADHLEDVGCGSLLLQGVAEFIQQARVLDRNYGLVGKRF